MTFWLQFKKIIRMKGLMFWTFIFPILLILCEFLAFNGIMKGDVEKNIDVYFVASKDFSPMTSTSVYASVYNTFNEAYDGDDKIFICHIINSEVEAADKLKNNTIPYYLIYKNDKIVINSYEQGVYLDVINSVTSESLFIQSSIKKAISSGAIRTDGNVINEEDLSSFISSYIINDNIYNVSSTSKASSPVIVLFYAALGMLCMFCSYHGEMIISEVRADKSSIGIRIASSPISRWKLFVNNILASMTVIFLSNNIVLIFMKLLKIDFGKNYFIILLFLTLGSLAGVLLGMALSVAFRVKEEARNLILTFVSLVLSMLGGTMGVGIKHAVDLNLGFVKYINPSSMITNGFYSLYYYDSYNSFIQICISLVIFVLLALCFTVYRIRGEKYDNI